MPDQVRACVRSQSAILIAEPSNDHSVGAIGCRSGIQVFGRRHRRHCGYLEANLRATMIVGRD